MDRGFIWIAQNNSTTDYIDLSRRLAQSIKKFNKHNNVCIITNEKVDYEEFDKIIVLESDYSKEQEWKMNNEWQVFNSTPFKHSIKLEADMLFTENTDWWWNYLYQYNMVFSYYCRNYKDDIIKQTRYRQLFVQNNLPNIYNGLTYFRWSHEANTFYNLCRDITFNWDAVKEKCLINCHDKQPTTDVVYALANKILDPAQERSVKYDWFNFIHNKNFVNGLTQVYNNDQYLNPIKIDNKIYSGGHRISRVWHYHNNSLPEELKARIF